MVNSWWLIVEAAVFTALLVYFQRLSYRCGIWDGAFNHFLPVVRQEMMFYDEHRAKLILDKEDEVNG